MANDALAEIASLGWHAHLEARNSSNERPAGFIDSQKCTFGRAITPDHVIAVIRKLLARSQPRKLSNDTISLHDYLGTLAIGNDPFAAPNKNGFGRTIMNRNEINKRKGPVGRRFQGGNINHFVDRHLDVG